MKHKIELDGQAYFVESKRDVHPKIEEVLGDRLTVTRIMPVKDPDYGKKYYQAHKTEIKDYHKKRYKDMKDAMGSQNVKKKDDVVVS